MGFFDSRKLFLYLTLLIIAVCTLLISVISSFEHKQMRVLTIFLMIFFVFIFLHIVSDGIKFIILAVETAFWPVQQGEVHLSKDITVHSRVDFLKMRLNGLRSQLIITEDHRNESLNLKYQIIAKDVFLYGLYFFCLMFLVLVTREELLHYDYVSKQKLFFKNQSLTLGLEYVRELDHLYTFINSTLIMAFNPNYAETGLVNWVYGDHTSKMGVVQMRQLRRKDGYHFSWQEQLFSARDYMENWETPYVRVPYTDKYWRIYEPWLPQSDETNKFTRLILDTDHKGYIQTYPASTGYITLLARSTNNSHRVIEYLRENNWLTWNTSAVFMELTLYNVDSRIFTIITLLVEQTPFGGIEPKVYISSVRLQVLDQLGKSGIIISIIYVVVVLQFTKTCVVNLWYEPQKLRSIWHKIDLIIVTLNIIVITIIMMRESEVKELLTKVENASKLEFMNFRKPGHLNSLYLIVMGFLVCITTLRLWRVLLFADVFQLFSATLYAAWMALAATAVVIIIFLLAFGIAVVILNGNNSGNFHHVTRSFVSAMCFAFGFSSQISPEDLFHGGKALGFIFYLILVFVVAQLLINIFISIINDYFEKARALHQAKAVQHINFLQFLRVEYASFFKFFQKLPCWNRGYQRKNRTVAENIKFALSDQDRWSSKKRYKALATHHHNTPTQSPKSNEATENAKYKRRIERMLTVAAIMQAQMELLKHFLFMDENENWVEESDDDNSNRSFDDDDVSVVYNENFA